MIRISFSGPQRRCAGSPVRVSSEGVETLAANAPSTSNPIARPTQRIEIAQVEALFSSVTLGVSAAALAAILLTGILHRLGFVDASKGLAWLAYMLGCAGSHILLRYAYGRARSVDLRWLLWARLFTAISVAEGLGWGWATIALAPGGRFDVELLVMITSLGIATGAISVFGSYLPAFFGLFLPATVPFAIASAVSLDPLERATCPMMLVYTVAMGALGVKANQSFKRLVGMRIRMEELAADSQRQKEIAEQANLTKSAFLAAASHDLRQPIHALGLFVGALRGIALPPEALRVLEQIEASTNAMDGLFSALLDISRLDAGVVEVHRRPFPIQPLLERICRDYADEANAKGIVFVRLRCTAIVNSDTVLVERILRNLVSNAVRYTRRGRIVIGCRRRGALVSIQVWDTGPGIPLGEREHIFQEYYQLGNPERDRTKGLGLGLAIVRRMTDLLGCRLTLRSRPGAGSCFEVEIPLVGFGAGAVESEPETASSPVVEGLIVVVDDEAAICRGMSDLLTGWGYTVVTAGSGDEAIQSLATCPIQPCLIICDYRLRDGESGVEVIERLRSEYNETIPAMLITGDTAPDRLIEAQAAGLRLLHKPVSNSKLRAAIVNLMASYAANEKAEPERRAPQPVR